MNVIQITNSGVLLFFLGLLEKIKACEVASPTAPKEYAAYLTAANEEDGITLEIEDNDGLRRFARITLRPLIRKQGEPLDCVPYELDALAHGPGPQRYQCELRLNVTSKEKVQYVIDTIGPKIAAGLTS